MDYEKVYKGLVAKVKKAYLYAQTDSTKNVLEDILPELRESEDESITRAINNMLPFIPDESYANNGVTKEGVLNWLEKQKEPKHAPDDLQKSFEAGQTSIVDNPEQYGLCKKAEWNEKDDEMLDAMIDIVSNSLYEPLCPREEMLAWLKDFRP